jgi:hypothetical protein
MTNCSESSTTVERMSSSVFTESSTESGC